MDPFDPTPRYASVADAWCAYKAGARFAVWSTNEDVVFYRTLEEARAASSRSRTWTDMEELIDAFVSVEGEE